MKKTRFTLFFLGVIGPVSMLSAATISTCYNAALRQSELILEQRELILQSREKIVQAQAAGAPTLTGTATIFTQAGAGSGDVGSSISPAFQPVAKITATHPLFRGFRDSALLRQTERLVSAQVTIKHQAMALLYLQVLESVYTITSLERDIANISTEIELYGRRVSDLKNRAQIGRSKMNDVLATQSTVAILEVQKKQLEAQLSAARDTLAFLTGLAKDTRLEVPLPSTGVPELPPIATYLSGISDRPDVILAQYQLKLADDEVAIAKGIGLPSADLSANLYFLRSGVNKDTNWDVVLGVSAPLLSGGSVDSKIRDAISKKTQAELTLARVKRQSESDIRRLYAAVQYDRDQLALLAKVTQLSEQTYRIQLQDSNAGLISNIEVLTALTNFQESGRAFDRTFYTALLDVAKLETAAEKRPYRRE